MSTRPKITALVSTYHKYAHAQHICDRFLEGYGWNGRHHRPEMDLVSLYVDQVDEERDVSRERAERFPQLDIYPSIADALTLGGSDLAVDGVLLIAEHGDYPVNEKQQTLWPRYEFFQQMASVFRTTGKSAPVFNDKHLSWSWDYAKTMYDTSRELGFPFMAGSSLPVTWRTPSLDMPLGAEVEEAIAAGEETWSDEVLLEMRRERAESDSFGLPDSEITHGIDVMTVLDRKRAAIRAHASQIAEDSFFLAMPDVAFAMAFGREWFVDPDCSSEGRSQSHSLLLD